MQRSDAIDGGRPFDWSRTSADYARWRSGPPRSFYDRLAAAGIGLPGQRLLDLGTGTGLLAREFARRGAQVVGVDLAAEQIAAAREAAAGEALPVEFRVAPAEDTGLPAASFDAITANQCWMYFDAPRATVEVRRLLAPGGLLCVSHFNWLPRPSEIARATEAVVLRFNPTWSGADWEAQAPPRPSWTPPDWIVVAMFEYDEPIPFTRESWRGRMRACRGVGASLSPEDVQRFDEALAELLDRTAPDAFTIPHRISAHLLALP
jgi:SAM-dependent methyltransferase